MARHKAGVPRHRAEITPSRDVGEKPRTGRRSAALVGIAAFTAGILTGNHLTYDEPEKPESTTAGASQIEPQLPKSNEVSPEQQNESFRTLAEEISLSVLEVVDAEKNINTENCDEQERACAYQLDELRTAIITWDDKGNDIISVTLEPDSDPRSHRTVAVAFRSNADGNQIIDSVTVASGELQQSIVFDEKGDARYFRGLERVDYMAEEDRAACQGELAGNVHDILGIGANQDESADNPPISA